MSNVSKPGFFDHLAYGQQHRFKSLGFVRCTPGRHVRLRYPWKNHQGSQVSYFGWLTGAIVTIGSPRFFVALHGHSQRSIGGDVSVFKFKFQHHLADRELHRFQPLGIVCGPFRCDVWLRDPRADHQRSQIGDFIRDIIPDPFQNAAERLASGAPRICLRAGHYE